MNTTEKKPGAAARILAADVGATHTRLALANSTSDFWAQRYRNDDFPHFQALLEQFRSQAVQAGIGFAPDSACLAVAGPISGRQASLTNRSWLIDADDLAASFNLPRLELVNDFFAAATGVAISAASASLVLQEGIASVGTGENLRLVVGPGTGLGVAFVSTDFTGRFKVHPSEGGHIGFAPQNAWENALLQWLSAQPAEHAVNWPTDATAGLPASRRINVEQILSGSGLIHIYRFLAKESGFPAARIDGPQIVEAGLNGNDANARRTLECFVSMLGAVVGDLALTVLPRGGVYLVGSIVNSLKPLLVSSDSRFLQAFNAKAEHAVLAVSFPVYLMTIEEIGLRGAIVCARMR